METEQNKQVVRALVTAINARDWESLDRLVSAHFIRHSAAAGEPGVKSRADLRAFLEREFEAFPDGRETLEDLIAEGDRVAARHCFHGTQHGALGPYPANGRTMRAPYLAIYRLEDGRIVEAWSEWDNLYALAQLGHWSTQEPGQRTATANADNR